MDKKYNEFKVVLKRNIHNGLVIVDGKPVIVKQEPTERGHVMISERDADTNNRQTRFNMKHYELAEAVVSSGRIALELEAKDLGITFRANIGDAKLLEKINEVK